MATSYKVLFTGGGGAGSEAIARLWANKYEVYFADSDVKNIPPAIAKEHRYEIALAGEAWVRSVADLCNNKSIDILVPTVDEELPLISDLKKMLPKLVVLAPDENFISMMNDKLQFHDALAQAGIDTPNTITMENAHGVKLPAFAKPRFGRGSRGIQEIRSADELQAYRVLSRLPDRQLLLQEFLVGQEWTVYVAADSNGNLRSCIPILVEQKRGVTIKAITIEHKAILKLVECIHKTFPTYGPYNVQLMETKDGRLSVFEINPRVSTTLCLAISAGADPIADFVSEKSTLSLSHFVSGKRLQRNWFNHIS